jgi:environmental stress-induced protein Ves
MSFSIIPKSNQKETEWSGGTTTQLYIYPDEATYQERNFLFRMSTASVKVPESTFTKLPGVSRVIMVLDGELKLVHENRYSKLLKKFDTDTFEGDWNTKSFGMVTDFNLMTSGNVTGNIRPILLQPEELVSKIFLSTTNFIGFYLLCGEVECMINAEKINFKEKDFLLLKRENHPQQLLMSALKYSEIIEVEIAIK